MISEYAVFEHDGLKIEANWNESVKPCEVIRFTIDGKVAYMDRAHLYQTLFLFGDDKQQADLIPQQEYSVKTVNRLLKVKLKKDMKKGEILAVNYEYFVPLVALEKIRLTPAEEKKYTKQIEEKAVLDKQRVIRG